MTNLVIIGAGGFALEVAAYAADITRQGKTSFALQGFLDDIKKPGSLHGGFPVLGNTDTALDPSAAYLIAVGSPQGRKQLTQKLAAKGAQFISLIHPLAYVSASAIIGEGSVMAPFSLAGPETRIGAQAVFNVYATAGHEAQMGAYCVLSPYASVHGQATLGEGVFIGGHGFVTAKIRVGNGAKIAAGAIVYNHIPAGNLAMGNPAVFRAQS